VNNTILSKSKKFVGEIFRQKGSDESYYHNFTHTAEVVKIAEEISTALAVKDDEREILLIAAWFHDIGYTKQCNGHEEIGVEIAQKFLRENEYPEEKIKRVSDLIISTKNVV